MRKTKQKTPVKAGTPYAVCVPVLKHLATLCPAKSENRTALEGVHIEPDGPKHSILTATDGRVIASIRVPIPLVFDKFTLPVSAIRAAKNADSIISERLGADGRKRMFLSETLLFDPVDMAFPPWRKALANITPENLTPGMSDKHWFDAPVLEKFFVVLSRLGARYVQVYSATAALSVCEPPPHGPVYARFQLQYGTDSADGIAAVMPMYPPIEALVAVPEWLHVSGRQAK